MAFTELPLCKLIFSSVHSYIGYNDTESKFKDNDMLVMLMKLTASVYWNSPVPYSSSRGILFRVWSCLNKQDYDSNYEIEENFI